MEYHNYGNMGCWGSKRGIQNKDRFFARNQYSKRKLMFFMIWSSSSKLEIILENEKFYKLKLSKKCQ